MMNEATNARLGELLENDEFLEKISKSGSLEETQSILKAEGVEMTIEEIQEAMEAGKELLKANDLISEDGELSEELLESVAGGKFRWKKFVLGLILTAAGCLSGNIGVAVLGAIIILC